MSGVWLTIITAVRDDREGLALTLRSLKDQDCRGIQLVIIDSSRDAAQVQGLLAEHQIPENLTVVLQWSPPAGIYAAMNLGLSHAEGRYSYFLNAGDELVEGSLMVLRTAIDERDVEWLYANVEIRSLDGTQVTTSGFDLRREAQSSFSRGHFPPHQGTVVRTQLLRDVGGFDTSYQIVADYATFLRLTTITSPVHLDQTLARFFEGGVSTRRWAQAVREFHRARRVILQPRGGNSLREYMGTVQTLLTTAFHRSAWPLALTLVLACLGVMLLSGTAWPTAALLSGLVLLQAAAGAVWWRLIQRHRAPPVLEVIGMGLALGTAGGMLAGLFLPWWVFPAASFGVWIALNRGLTPPTPLAPLQRPDVLALASALVAGFGALVITLRTYPLEWSGTWSSYHGDMPFFEAVAASVARLGPTASIFMDGAELRYHSLGYGWAGQLTVATDAAPFVSLTRLLPAVTLIMAVSIAAVWTRQLTRVWWAPTLAALLLVTGGFVGATFGVILNFDSPSQALTSGWLLAFSLAVMTALRERGFAWFLPVIAALTIALTGGKISTGAVALIGVASVFFVAVVRGQPWWRRTLVILLVGASCALLTYVWLLSGSANAGGLDVFSLLDRASSVQSLNPVITPRGVVAGIFILIIAVLPRWFGLFWLMSDSETRWRPETAFGLGLAVAGVATLVLLSGGFNDLWFAVAASAPLCVLSAFGIARASTWLGPHLNRRILVAVGGGALIAVVVTGLWLTGSTGVIGNGWRWASPIVAWLLAGVIGLLLATSRQGSRLRVSFAFVAIIVVTMAIPSRILFAAAAPLGQGATDTWSGALLSSQDDYVPIIDKDRARSIASDELRAGAWLRANATGLDLVATNRTGSSLVPALTRLPTYLSDLRLQAPYGRKADVREALARETDSWAFIDSPTRETFAPLCSAGVRWLWIDPRLSSASNWEPFGRIVLQSQNVTIVELRPNCS